MSRFWLRALSRTLGLKNKQIRPIRRSSLLQIDHLEDRLVPATPVTFQQGLNLTGTSTPYTGTLDTVIRPDSPLNIINGNNATGVYALDGNGSGDIASPNRWLMVRFDSIFGTDPGQIPVGSTITSATLRFTSSTDAEVGSATSGGPWGVSQLLVPFTASSSWGSLGVAPYSPDAERAGHTLGIGAATTTATLSVPGTANTTSGVSTGTLASGNRNVTANVADILQNWSNNPSANFGFQIRAMNHTDGWGVRSSNYTTDGNIDARPRLDVTYDPPATNVTVTSFQQGTGGYAGSVSVRLLDDNSAAIDGATLTAPAFIDGKTTLTSTSSNDQQMLIRFNSLFGNGPGQIPAGATNISATLELTTGASGDSGSAQSLGGWAASQVMVNWPLDTKMNDAIWTTGGTPSGPSHSKSRVNSNPTVNDTNAELKVLSLNRGFSGDQKAYFDVSAAVAAWQANPSTNFGLNVQAANTEDGWAVHFTGSAAVAARPRLIVRYTAPAELAANTVDLVGGQLVFTGGAALSNALNVSVSGSTYTLTDTSGNIALTQAAKDAGWMGDGTTSITGLATTLPNGLAISTGTGDDTITIASAINRLIINAGGQANDLVAIAGSINTANGDVAITGTGSITASAASLIETGTGSVTLAASNAVGTGALPVNTKAARLSINAGNGGAFVAEADGADLVADVGGTGVLSVTNAGGALTVPLNELTRTQGGNLTLSSTDDVIVNGTLGIAGPAAGVLTVSVNADGTGAQGFTQGNRGILSSQGPVTVTVNTGGGGTGNATLGVTGVNDTFTVAANGGNILWNSLLSNFADSIDYTNASVTARHVDFKVTGATSSIGTLATPIPTFNLAGTDAVSASKASLQAGGGGIYLLDRSDIDLTVTKAIATGAGDVRITTGRASGNNLFIDGTVSTGTGAIVLRSDDNLTLTANAIVGGPGFGGTITINTNIDTAGEDRFTQTAGSIISTANTSSAAAVLTYTGIDANSTTVTIGGYTLGNITVGDGGTISVTIPYVVPTNSFTGNITQLPGTLLDAGGGKVVLAARALIQTDLVTPAVTSGIGTATDPIRIKAATASVTSINAPAFVVGSTATTFTAVANGRTVPADAAAVIPLATLNLATSAGTLTIAGASSTDGGSIALTSPAGVIVNGVLGDTNTGSVTIDAGTASIVFNSNYTVVSGTTSTFLSPTATVLGTTTTNSGTIIAANGVQVGAGRTLTGAGSITGPVTVLANGIFTPAGAVTGIVTTGNLLQSPASVLIVNVNGLTPGTQHDQVKAHGTVDVTGANLRLNVGSVVLGNSFTIVDNDGTGDAVVGQFAAGTTVRGFNNPLVTFTLNYAGGDGNDIVATVSDISTAKGLLDVQGNQVIYYSNTGVDNSVAVTQTTSNFVITESAAGAAISLTQSAKDAGWAGDNTPTVTGPKGTVAGLNFGLSDGTDTFTTLDAGLAAIAITGGGTVTFNGVTSTTSAFSIDEFSAVILNGAVSAGTGASFTGLNSLILSGTGTLSTAAGNITTTRFGDIALSGVTLTAAAGSITFTGTATTTTNLASVAAITLNAPTVTAAGSNVITITNGVTASVTANLNAASITAAGTSLITAPTLNLTGTTVGAAGSPILSKAITITANGTGGVFVTEANGATITAVASGTGDVTLDNLLGTLTLAGTTRTGSGLITVSSKDGITLDGTLGGTGFSGKFSINANTDGAGSEGYTQSITANLATTNTASDAASITVNTATGTGNAVLGIGSIGGNGGGGLAVSANKGSILWNPAFGTVTLGTLPLPTGGSNPTNVLKARDYQFSTAADGGSVGTLDTPIQTSNYGTDGAAGNSVASIAAGTGGIFLTDWSGVDLTIGNASAAAGNIQIFSGNEGGHNLFVTGTVFTGNGNIWLAADDDLPIQGSTIGGPIFAGTIRLEANRDNGNEQRISMSGVGSVETTSKAADAITFITYATDNDASNATLGGVTLGTVKTGDGGTVTINTTPDPLRVGNVIQILGSRIDTGEGAVNITVRNLINGLVPASGAGVRYDLDGTGINTGPLQVKAKTVNVIAFNTPVNIAEGDGGFFTDSNGFDLAASASGLGEMQFLSKAGVITLTGAVNSDVAAITVTASDATTGGIVVSAALADSNTGPITLDAGTKTISFTANYTTALIATTTLIAGSLVALGPVTTVSSGATITAANGVAVATGRTLAGIGTVNAVTIVAGTLAPGLAGPGTLNTGALALSGSYNVDLNGTAANSFDQTKITGTVDLTGSKLVFLVNSNFIVGNSFTIIDNDLSDAVTGSFAGGPDYTAINDPRYIFSVTTTGGDGNDVVLTVTAVLPTVLDVTAAGLVQYSSDANINDTLSVDIVGSKYEVTNTATTIGLTVAAKNAGWTGHNTNTVTGPTLGVTGLSIATANGTDTLTKLTAGVPTAVTTLAALTITGPAAVTGTLDVNSATSLALQSTVSATGTFTATGIGAITATNTSLLTAPTVTLTATNALGTGTDPIRTTAGTLNLIAGDGGLFLTETDGADVTATATNAGAIAITNTAGTLRAAGAITTGSGPITLTSGDALTIDAVVGGPAFSGTIALAANTDGAGTQGYTSTLNGSLVTLNTTATAVTLAVNTTGGGTGDAILGVGVIGSSSGGTIAVDANAGSILWNPAYTFALAAPDGGGNTNVIIARDYSFKAGNAIGTAASPIQIDALGTADGIALGNTFNATAGSGGVYAWEWGGVDLTITGATATGAGAISIVTANAGGNNLFITGAVSTGSGNIYLAANDNVNIGPGVVIGGPGFSGTVTVSGNRDKATDGQPVFMDATASIVTSNTTANAVLVNLFGDAGNPSTITVANITTGNGGTITLDDSPEGEAGIIVAQPGTKLDTGSTGTVLFNSRRTTGSGDAIGTALTPISVVAGSVGFLSTNGNVYIVDPDGVSVAGNNGGAAGVTNLTSTAGLLTVVGPLASDGGAINLNAVDGIAVTGSLGDTNVGVINVNGPLSGAGTIALGSGDLNLTQATASTFAGSISGAKSVIKLGSGNLTFSGSSPVTGGVAVSDGTLTVTGSLTGSSGVTVAAPAALAGTGTVSVPVSVSGALRPGTTGAGTLTTANVNFTTGGSVDIDLLGVALIDIDRLNVVGNVSLVGAKLNITPGFAAPLNSKFTIIDNDDADSIGGAFTNAPTEGSIVTGGGQSFSVSYVGGDGNDVVLTRVANATPNVTGFIVNGGATQRSRITQIELQFDSTVVAANFNSLGAIQLKRTAVSSLPTGAVNDIVQTGPAAANHITVTQGTASSLILTFDNNGSFTTANTGVENGSLSDGYWQILQGSYASPNPTTNLQLRRLFGDSTVEAGGLVDGADGIALGNDFNSSLPAFDFNNDGLIDGSDGIAFGNRFGNSL